MNLEHALVKRHITGEVSELRQCLMLGHLQKCIKVVEILMKTELFNKTINYLSYSEKKQLLFKRKGRSVALTCVCLITHAGHVRNNVTKWDFTTFKQCVKHKWRT